MTEAATTVPFKTETKSTVGGRSLQTSNPFASLYREIDRLFDTFDSGFWRSPFRRPMFEPGWQLDIAWAAAPAVDITETDKAYEITAELPGMDEKNIEVKLTNGDLRIKGEKQDEKEEKKKDYYLHERQFGSFERCFSIPEGVDADKIQASFKKGLLKVTLPKKPEAVKPEKKIEIKAAA